MVLLSYTLLLVLFIIVIVTLKKTIELSKAVTKVNNQLKELSDIKKILSSVMLSRESEKLYKKLKKRIRRRYIVFRIVTEEEFELSPDIIEDLIHSKIEELFGSTSIAMSNIRLVYYDPRKKTGIIATTNEYKSIVIVSLSLIRRVDGKECIVIPLRTYGTIKQAIKSI